MADLHSKWLFGNLVYYDRYQHRWLDAMGMGVQKFNLNTVYLPVDDTTGDPDGFTMTVVEAGASNSTVALTDGAFVITTDANDNDGVNLQVKGEAFKLDATTKRIYFGINFQASEATQSDFLVGLCITDTDLLGGMTDGVYFRKVDASTSISFVLEKDSTETTGTVGTFADATNITLEFMFDGTYVDSWVNGVLQTRLATTNLPDNEFLTPSIHFLAGAATAKTMTVNWMRAISIDGTK